MKFLFTGMTSKHSSKSVHLNNLSFFGNLELALKDSFPDAEVVWSQPSVLWEAKDLEQYDRVFVGVVPPTAISANHLYGALKVIGLLKGSDKLTIALDHNELWQYKTAFASIAKNSEYLSSTFYAKRKEYDKASKFLVDFSNTANHLLNEDWGSVIYPSLPWRSANDVVEYSKLPISELVGINLDQYSVEKYESAISDYRNNTWALSSNNAWAKSSVKSQKYPVMLMKPTKKSDDISVFSLISKSIGSLIPPNDRNSGTWWSHRYIQSLLAQTPIATEWRESSLLGESWSLLPYQIEDMSPATRLELAVDQKNLYLASIGSKKDVILQMKKLHTKNGE
jgi:hypothetical protein